MNVYSSQEKNILAMQVSKSRLTTGAIRNIDKSKIVVSSEFASVKTAKGLVMAMPGDWIVVLTDKQILVLPNYIFEILYHKI